MHFGEPQLDLIQPRGIGGREVERDVRVLGKKRGDLLRRVGRQVVDDDVNLLIGLTSRDDGSQKGDELVTRVPRPLLVSCQRDSKHKSRRAARV